VQLPVSTTYRYVSALKKSGFIEEADTTGTYHLGETILSLARNVPKKRLQDIAIPFMHKLSSQTGEAICLSTLHDNQGVCIERVEAQHSLRVSHALGAIFPLHAGTSGKILMAYLDRKEQERIIADMGLPRFSDTTIIDAEILFKELANIRKQGYALSDGEVIPGTYGIGAPIMSRTGKAIAALSISAPIQRMEEARQRKITAFVVATAKKISTEFQSQEI
jgi:DNA-binding IclR family transcriptional regulator